MINNRNYTQNVVTEDYNKSALTNTKHESEQTQSNSNPNQIQNYVDQIWHGGQQQNQNAVISYSQFTANPNQETLTEFNPNPVRIKNFSKTYFFPIKEQDQADKNCAFNKKINAISEYLHKMNIRNYSEAYSTNTFLQEMDKVKYFCNENYAFKKGLTESVFFIYSTYNAKFKLPVINYFNSEYTESIQLKNNRESLLEEAEKNPQILAKAPKELRKDKDFIFNAILFNVAAMEYAEELKKDRSFVIEIFNYDPGVYPYISEDLKKDPELHGIFYSYMNHTGGAFAYHCAKRNLLETAKEFKCEYKIVHFQQPSLDRLSSTEMLSLVKENKKLLRYSPSELLNDEYFMYKSICNYPKAFKYASKELKNDKRFILRLISTQFSFDTKFIPEELLKDEEIAKAVHEKLNSRFMFYGSDEDDS